MQPAYETQLNSGLAFGESSVIDWFISHLSIRPNCWEMSNRKRLKERERITKSLELWQVFKIRKNATTFPNWTKFPLTLSRTNLLLSTRKNCILASVLTVEKWTIERDCAKVANSLKFWSVSICPKSSAVSCWVWSFYCIFCFWLVKAELWSFSRLLRNKQ